MLAAQRRAAPDRGVLVRHGSGPDAQTIRGPSGATRHPGARGDPPSESSGQDRRGRHASARPRTHLHDAADAPPTGEGRPNSRHRHDAARQQTRRRDAEDAPPTDGNGRYDRCVDRDVQMSHVHEPRNAGHRHVPAGVPRRDHGAARSHRCCRGGRRGAPRLLDGRSLCSPVGDPAARAAHRRPATTTDVVPGNWSVRCERQTLLDRIARARPGRFLSTSLFSRVLAAPRRASACLPQVVVGTGCVGWSDGRG